MFKTHKPGSMVRFDKRFRTFVALNVVPASANIAAAQGFVRCAVTGQGFAVTGPVHVFEHRVDGHPEETFMLIGPAKWIGAPPIDNPLPEIVGICFLPGDKRFAVVDMNALVSV